MRITTTRNTRIPASRQRKAGRSGGEKFAVAGVDEAAGRAPAENAAPVNAVAGLLALQEIEQESPRQRAIAHGRAQLDLLDELKLGLLASRLPVVRLSQLAQTVEARHRFGVEPQLRDLLGHIDLRARVELAKLEKLPGCSRKSR